MQGCRNRRLPRHRRVRNPASRRTLSSFFLPHNEAGNYSSGDMPVIVLVPPEDQAFSSARHVQPGAASLPQVNKTGDCHSQDLSPISVLPSVRSIVQDQQDIQKWNTEHAGRSFRRFSLHAAGVSHLSHRVQHRNLQASS